MNELFKKLSGVGMNGTTAVEGYVTERLVQIHKSMEQADDQKETFRLQGEARALRRLAADAKALRESRD